MRQLYTYSDNALDALIDKQFARMNAAQAAGPGPDHAIRYIAEHDEYHRLVQYQQHRQTWGSKWARDYDRRRREEHAS